MSQSPETLTPEQLDSLRALVPAHVRVDAEPGRVLVTFSTPGTRGGGQPLFTYEILAPGNGSLDDDLPLLSLVVEDLATVVTRLHREVLGEAADDIFSQALRVINGASRAVTGQHLRQGGLRILTQEIHSLDEEDWLS